jgi:hypothetical protein
MTRQTFAIGETIRQRHLDAMSELEAENARLREALAIERTPKCFSCGAKVTVDCPRPRNVPCGRQHLGGARAALTPAPVDGESE